MQFEGWESFDERRRLKHQKQLEFRVAGDAGVFDEGADKSWHATVIVYTADAAFLPINYMICIYIWTKVIVLWRFVLSTI